MGVDETMVLVTRLPDDFTQTSFAIRSSLQDVRFYVDGELRSEYHTDKTRLNGKNSASRYVFCPTSEKDAGKMLQIELTTHTDNYSGVVNTVYCGDKGDIWASIFRDYGLETIIAFFLLFVGLVTIIFSVALGIAYHTRFDMEYLGWCILMGAGGIKTASAMDTECQHIVCSMFSCYPALPGSGAYLYGQCAEKEVYPYVPCDRICSSGRFCGLYAAASGRGERFY